MRYIILFSFLLSFISVSAQQVSDECANCFTCTQLMQCFGDVVCADCDVENEIQTFSSPGGTIVFSQSDPLNIKMDVNLECCEVLCASTPALGTQASISGVNVGSPFISDPFSIITLANANSCEAVADIDIAFPDVDIILIDAYVEVRGQYQILVNGAAVEGWVDSRRIRFDRRSVTGGPHPRQTLGSNFNIGKIYVAPGDVIQVQQRVVVVKLNDNNAFDDIINIVNGQSKISLYPRFIYAK